MNRGTKILNVAESVLFLLYFAVLTAERLISLVASFGYGFSQMDALDKYITVLTVVALVGGWAYLVVFGRKIFKFTQTKSGADFRHPSIAAGIILLGGMVHTVGTVAPVQFAAYGCLLVAMAIYTARCTAANGDGLKRWWTFAYVVAFSMAIPVVYKMGSGADRTLATTFYCVETVTSAALVALFAVMLLKFYENKSQSTFCPFVWGFAAIADAAVLGLRWNDEINVFVLIFASLMFVLGIVGKIMVLFDEKKGKTSADASADK